MITHYALPLFDLHSFVKRPILYVIGHAPLTARITTAYVYANSSSVLTINGKLSNYYGIH